MRELTVVASPSIAAWSSLRNREYHVVDINISFLRCWTLDMHFDVGLSTIVEVSFLETQKINCYNSTRRKIWTAVRGGNADGIGDFPTSARGGRKTEQITFSNFTKCMIFFRDRSTRVVCRTTY